MDFNESSVEVVVGGLLPLGAESVSPVTLSSDWSRVARLLLLVSLAIIGSVGNVFMISAVMIEDHLKKRGNAFIVNVALADLLITGLVMPSSAVVILADADGSLSVCQFQWFLAVLCFLVTVVTLSCTAAENYCRVCSPAAGMGTPSAAGAAARGAAAAAAAGPAAPGAAAVSAAAGESRSAVAPGSCPWRDARAVTALVLATWVVCGAASALQFARHVGFDYCSRRHAGLLPYHATVAVVLVFVPTALTCWWYARALWRVRAARRRPSFKPPVTFAWDYALLKTNLYSFLMFVVFWLPFGTALAAATVRHIPDKIFYNLAWFALSKSCVNNILYCVTNRHFRNAYVNLFHYCCCKTTVSFSRRQRAAGLGVGTVGVGSCGLGDGGGGLGGGGLGGGGGSTRPSGDVRVHIIPGYNMYTSPQRARDAPGKRTASCRPGGSARDVYEL